MNKHSRRKHFFIPDTQVSEGVNTDHLEAAGKYAAEKKPDVIVAIGDWWDMPSLSTYEKKGSKYFHGKSYLQDVQAGNEAMRRFMQPIRDEIARLVKNKKKAWAPELHFCLGNHEYRIERAVHEDPNLEGIISYADLDLSDWVVHPFLEMVEIDGVLYSHYFVNPDSLVSNPIGGTIENKLKLVGQSFSMGHQQRRQYGTRFTSNGKELHGLVCGAFYSHDEAYLGPQKNKQYWRGAVMKHEVHNGTYDPMFLSLNYLVERYS